LVDLRSERRVSFAVVATAGWSTNGPRTSIEVAGRKNADDADANADSFASDKSR
jgi:hypothetical protein